MIILKSINQNQTIHFITKAENWDLFTLTDEQTKEVINVETFTYVIGDYTTALTCNFYTLVKQNHTYTLELKSSISEKVVFRDKVLITNQNNLEKFSTVNGRFTSNETLNEFVIYE